MINTERGPFDETKPKGFDKSGYPTAIFLPENAEQVKELRDKLADYENRLGRKLRDDFLPYTQISEYYKARILNSLLVNRSVTSELIKYQISKEHGGQLPNEFLFNESLRIIFYRTLGEDGKLLL